MPAALSPTALALGRIPTGLFVVATATEEGPMGFLGSFLVQVGFDPPTLCVAIARSRPHLEAIRTSGRFGVSVLDERSGDVAGTFLKKRTSGSPFDEVDHRRAPGGSPVLPSALAWLECRATGEHETGDHVVVFGEVEAAELLREGDPRVHLRRNGLGY